MATRVFILLFIVIHNLFAEPLNDATISKISEEKQLFTGVKEDNLNKVKAILSKRKDLIKSVDKYKRTALMYAKSVDIANLLIKSGVDIKAKDYKGRNALMYAWNKDIAKLLLNYGLDINSKDDMGRTALINTCNYLAGRYRSRKYSLIKFFLENGSKINITDKKGENILFYCGSGLDDEYKKTIELLIANKADLNKANNEGITPIMEAAKLSNWTNINEGIRLLLKQDVNINGIYKKTGRNILMEILYHQKKFDLDNISTLLKKGIDINHQDKSGQTALLYASISYFSTYELLKLLVDNKADVNLKNKFGRTALLELLKGRKSIKNNINSIKYLLLNGADINIKDISGHDIYYYAKAWERTDVLDLLALIKGKSKEERKKYLQIEDEKVISNSKKNTYSNEKKAVKTLLNAAKANSNFVKNSLYKDLSSKENKTRSEKVLQKMLKNF